MLSSPFEFSKVYFNYKKKRKHLCSDINSQREIMPTINVIPLKTNP